ncbi:serine protease [Streptomyces marispadix]|uniref:Serine protease n=1 Tax=Streptomyces marispadix TaxID=2922868 RepID=A0ABS9T345_9ACTN|nr:serine protease [Streptomyces marispadix]MCH6162941.1 serine protease [Streptomyces marispadix]
MTGTVPAEQALVRICDPAGRPRGTGFVADGRGTVITSHEAVDGLDRLVVYAREAGGLRVESGWVTPLPEWDLALIRTDGLGVAPLLIGSDRAGAAAPTPVQILTLRGESEDQSGGRSQGESQGVAGSGSRADATLTGTATAVTYTSAARRHELDGGALELSLTTTAAARRFLLDRTATGSPVLDPRTGAVLGVVGTALHVQGGRSLPDRRGAGFAVPLRRAGLWDLDGQLADTLAHNAATVPGFGPDLNLAGALRLTAATVRPAAARAQATAACHVERPEVTGALREFGESGASVTALVGRPGTGRTTCLAEFAAIRADGARPAPTVWLRGAQLRAGDGSVREALGRALRQASRQMSKQVSKQDVSDQGGPDSAVVESGAPSADGPDDSPCADVVSRLAREARRPLLVLLDAPEEMPPALCRDLRRWTAGTAGWLSASGARLIVACGPEQWERLGPLFPAGMLYDGRGGALTPDAETDGPPPCVRLCDLPAAAAADARGLYGLGTSDLAAPDAAHPLAMRMLAEIHADQHADRMRGDAAPSGPAGRVAPQPRHLSRDAVFSAYLDLVALRVARRLDCTATPVRMRRLAARTAGALHEAARRSLGPARGVLSRAAFEEVFPWEGGWAQSVLADGVLEAAGGEVRFADEEFGEWMQGRHLDVDAALSALVHEPDERGGGALVPRERIGPVVHALVLCGALEGAGALERRLRPLADMITSTRPDKRPGTPSGTGTDDPGRGPGPGSEARWWARRLLRDTLLRVPDARPHYGLLRGLAEHFGAQPPGAAAEFGPSFWRRLALPIAQRTGLLRLLLPADAPPGAGGAGPDGRYLDVVGELLTEEPETVLPLLCGWFTDRRPLTGLREAEPCGGPHGRGDADAEAPRATVASAAQALLYAHRRQAGDMLLDLLTDACHPRADELLDDLAQEEPSALCRAVDRWANHAASLRRTAAAEYGPLMVRQTRSDTDRRHLERAAHALLRVPGSTATHGPSAMAMLLRLRQQAPELRPDAQGPSSASSAAARPAADTRQPEGSRLPEGSRPPEGTAEGDRELGTALGLLAATGAVELADALTDEIEHRPERALAAFRSWLCAQPGGGARHLTAVLAAVRIPRLAVSAAEVVREYAELRPETAGDALAAFVRGRIARRPRQCCPALQSLTDALLCTPYAPLRAALARALGALGGPVAEELLSVLLVGERDPGVLDAALEAVARRGEGESDADGPGAHAARTGQTARIVRQLGLLMARTPEEAARFERRVAELSREVPGFARALRSGPEGFGSGGGDGSHSAARESGAAAVAPHTSAAPSASLAAGARTGAAGAAAPGAPSPGGPARPRVPCVSR